jgi:hypothetical protein
MMNKERAYKILNLEDKSRNDGSVITSRDVEKSYRELLHSKHPDKGGTKEEFLELQSARRTALGEQQLSVPSSSRGSEYANHHHRHFVSSKTFPKHLKLMLGSLVVVVCGLNAAKLSAKERKKKRSPGVRAALGLYANKEGSK